MVKKKKIIAIVQARLGSKRFPRKVLKKINNLSIVEIINKRLTKSKLLDEIVFAIPSSKENQKLYNHLSQINCKIFRGDENNVTNFCLIFNDFLNFWHSIKCINKIKFFNFDAILS